MNTKELPLNYEIYKNYDLKRKKKMTTVIQISTIIIIAVFILLARFLHFPMRPDWHIAITISLTVLMCIIYILAHELVHGIFIRILSGLKPNFFLRFPFISTGSDKAYFNKKSFIWIALSPIIIWGATLLVLLFVVPENLFLSFYIVFIINIAGSSGDFLQVYEILKLPEKALIMDNGKETFIYIPKDC